jgi:tetratricopeptide (TPR) repeat protein
VARELKSIEVTKSAKIAVVVALSLVIIMVTVMSGAAVGVYYFLEFRKGDQFYREGYAAEEREDHDVAIEKLSQALKHKLTKNDLAEAYSSRGAAYRSKGRFEEAARDFSEAIRLYPNWAYAYFARGWTHQLNGEPDKAIPDFKEAIRYDANYGWAYYDRGLLYLRRQQWDSAIADFDEAIRCLPNNLGPLLARGQSYLGKKDFDRALANFDGAVAVNSLSPLGYFYRSNIYFIKGDGDKQLRDLKEAERVASIARHYRARSSPLPYNYPDVYQRMGLAYDQGDYDRAIDLANELVAMEIDWSHASPVLMDRGNAFRAKGNFDKALVDYDQAIAFNPKNAGAHVDRALVWEKKGRRDQALRDYAEAIRLDPKMWQAHFDRAISFRETGEFAKAIEDMSEVIKLKLDYVPAYLVRAADHYRLGQVDQALEDWNRAAELNFSQVEAYVGRTMAYLKKKDYVKAAQEMEMATRVESKTPAEILNSLAWLQATSPDKRARNGAAAIDAATKVCQSTQWNNWRYVDTLAAAYAEAGKFTEAVNYQKLALRTADGPTTITEEAKKRLNLYEQHKPYREEDARKR